MTGADLSWLAPPYRTAGFPGRPVQRICAVIAGENPSFDYYLRPRLALAGAPVFRTAQLDQVPPDMEWDGTLLIFCRYLSSAWLRAAETRRDRLAGVALFMDDDMEAVFADGGVPLFYRGRLLRRNFLHRRRLNRMLNLLMVSNARLAARHAQAAPLVLHPVASAADTPRRREDGPLRIAFHSSIVHEREHRWLRPVIAQVLDRAPDISFEVIADPWRMHFWRGLPRTQVLPAMAWPDYRDYTAAHGADLLLAPLLPGAGNAARSQTKRIDAQRLDAALLVSDAGVYEPGAEEKNLGMCVPLSPTGWGEAILALCRDAERRRRLRDANRRHLAGLAQRIEKLPF